MALPHIRRLHASDTAEHVRMRVALWPDEDVRDLASESATMRADPNQVVFVAERDDGRLGGMIEARLRPFAYGADSQPCAFVEGWWVAADPRPTGLGRALIAAVENWARERGFHELGSDALLDNLVSHQAHRALGFEERLGLLVDLELQERENRRLQRSLKAAKLRTNAVVEDIDFRRPRGLDRGQILNLAESLWVANHHTVLIVGATGLGKSFLACALAHAAIRHG